jgi:hypothetical protein
LHFYQKALEINLVNKKEDDSVRAAIYHNIATVYYAIKDFK